MNLQLFLGSIGLALLALPGFARANDAERLVDCLNQPPTYADMQQQCWDAFFRSCITPYESDDWASQTACFLSFKEVTDGIASRSHIAAQKHPHDFGKRFVAAAWKLALREAEAGCDFVVETSREFGADTQYDQMLFAQCYAGEIAKAIPNINAWQGNRD
ncbi:hypothetical protein [Ruegeria jejuensis]|uniref:hypothetical protein n=1 Tax=Ruegeria jejuensis TaxID=3233338 RepID=UPI00355BD2DC